MLKDLVGDDLHQVNHLILDRMRSPVALIPTLAGHLINSGGKRIRPLLTLASARLCGYDGTLHHNLAAAVEFIHTATLLHDDVVDESDNRRGQMTANVLWGNQASVLVGDFLFSRAFQLMVECGDLRVLDILSRASAIIAEGEVLQLSILNDLSTTEQTYFDMISAKTAALFEAATRVGAVVSASTDAREQALLAYGQNLGIAFQLVDDALDYSGLAADLGKSVGDDFKEGKITLPVLLAYERSTSDERTFWVRTVEQLDQTEEDLHHAVGRIAATGALEATMAKARSYAAQSLEALSIFPPSRYRQA
ncbi:MAG: polyprenyl synthetase family protein, partial [Pseudomonadota bacterium]